MTKGEMIQNGLSSDTLIDEHVYVPAKMLWAVITIAAIILMTVIGGIVWITTLRNDVNYLKESDQQRTQVIVSLTATVANLNTTLQHTQIELAKLSQSKENTEKVVSDIKSELSHIRELYERR